jgi:hypothetical protein
LRIEEELDRRTVFPGELSHFTTAWIGGVGGCLK